MIGLISLLCTYIFLFYVQERKASVAIHRFIGISGVETKLGQIKSYSNSVDALPSLSISLHEARNRSTTDHKHSTNPAVPNRFRIRVVWVAIKQRQDSIRWLRTHEAGVVGLEGSSVKASRRGRFRARSARRSNIQVTSLEANIRRVILTTNSTFLSAFLGRISLFRS